MTWDLTAVLILMLLAVLCALLPAFVVWVKRVIWWRRVRPYRDCYITYRDNRRWRP